MKPSTPSPSSSKERSDKAVRPDDDDDDDNDEEDPYVTRIEKTGCSLENENLQLCFHDTKDWRLCRDQLERFRECWQRNKSKDGAAIPRP